MGEKPWGFRDQRADEHADALSIREVAGTGESEGGVAK